MAEPAPPERIGRYRILERIGRGGMGEIYTARDEGLDRIVAVKTISPRRALDEDARRRLILEARAAASLSHPFICTIHEALETDGGPVIVMEYVPGETVAARARAGPIPHRELCRLADEVAEALAAAHARGIVHRDITANNVMITSDGHAKVMDFGLARVQPAAGVDAETRSLMGASDGLIVGTPAYLAPELLRGQRASVRSDLYGFGAVMYLMATGRLPFGDASTDAQLMADILTRVPVAPRSIVPSLPWPVERIIQRLLDKAPENRFGSAADVRAALAQAAAAHGAPHAAQSIAVLPFTALGQGIDPDLGAALADATITDLASIRSLLVRPTSAVLRYRDMRIDPLQAGRELSAEFVVSGSLQRSGRRIRVSVQVHATSDGRSVWATKIDSSLDDVFGMQDEVSREIARSLEVRLTQADGERLEAAPKAAGAAREHFLRGRLHMMRETVESVDAAVRQFQRAIEIEPSFAQAYAELSAAYFKLGFSFRPGEDYHARAAAMAEKALAIDPALPEGRFLRASLLWNPTAGFNHEPAIRELNAAVAGGPGLHQARDFLGIVLLHVSLFDESAREFERALAISPDDGFAYVHVGLNKYYSGDWSAALDISEESWRRAPTAWSAYQLTLVQVQLQRLEEAERIAVAAQRQFPGDVLFHPLLGLVAALRGDDRESARRIELTVANHKAFGHYHHAQYDIACIHAMSGRPELGMQWLTDAARNGFPCHGFFERDRLIQPLHALPAFEALLAESKAESERCLRAYRETATSTGVVC